MVRETGVPLSIPASCSRPVASQEKLLHRRQRAFGRPIKRQVMKLKVKLEDSSVDLNDPAVKAGILKKFQDRLEENGLSGVTLKWREQPDGKVFHKEKEADVTHDKC
ncbi:hypothetical protein Q8A73_013355 [Channa argus]|nr:hypothetical protein Q8A73_013355 [Channa argus]